MTTRRSFSLGALFGLSLGRVLHRVGGKGFAQDRSRRTYGVWARIYGLANALTSSPLPRLWRTAIDRLRLVPGASVLGVSCGTGASFALLQERIKPRGRLVGVDSTNGMLNGVRLLVRRKGWQKLELVQADATTQDLYEPFNGVLWTLAASVVPDWRAALERAIAHARLRKRIVIADARFSERWHGRPFNWYTDIIEWVASGDISRRPWELLPEHFCDVGYLDQFLGFFYVAWGQRPLCLS